MVETTKTEKQSADGNVYAFPCSVVQRICWFLDRMSPQTSMMNIAVRFLLEGPLRVELLEASISEVIRRHEILRTRFALKEGEPVQVVDPPSRFTLPVIDLSELRDSERESEAERLAAEEALIGFDIERGPLFRARLIRTETESSVLLITMHHIISDGWSVGVVTNELGEIYEALSEYRTHSLPPLAIQYGDYACWQRDWIASGELDEQLEKLKIKLDGFEPLVIATDFERPLVTTTNGEIRSMVLPRSLTDALKRLSDGEGCTLFVTILSAFLVLMHRDSGQTEVTLRTQAAGRNRVELEPLIGWFVNSIVLRTDLSGDPDFLTLVDRVRQVVLESFEYQDVPFERLMEVLRPGRSAPRHPPFQVNFIFQRDLVAPWTRAGVRMTPIPSKAAGCFCDLNFFLVERKDGWRASVDVNTKVFRPETGEQFLESFLAIIESVARNPHQKISGIPIPEVRRAGLSGQSTDLAGYVAPRNALESQIVDIWENVLNVRPIGVETNFVDLGGHSLLAVPVLTQIHARFGQKVALAQLFANPTVAAMAKALDPSSAPDARPDLLHVQPCGSRPPFFMVGGDHWFRPLARGLGLDQPFLGLSLQRYESRPVPTSFREIGRDLAQLMIDVYPSGPYLLGGWCVDGAVAYEVAQQLSAMGKQVAFVALMDAVNPAYRRLFRSRRRAVGRLLMRTIDLARTAGEIPLNGGSAQLRHRVTHALKRMGKAVAPTSVADEQDDAIVQNDPDRQEFRKLLYRAEDEYTPVPTSIPLLLLRSPVSRYQDPDLGWREVAQASLETFEVSGDHIAMFREPNVASLTSVLRRYLDRV